MAVDSLTHQAGVICPPFPVRGHRSETGVVEGDFELVGIFALTRQAEHLVEVFHPGCGHAGLHPLVEGLGLAHLAVTPDLLKRSRTHNHDFIADDAVDELVRGFIVDLLAGCAV